MESINKSGFSFVEIMSNNVRSDDDDQLAGSTIFAKEDGDHDRLLLANIKVKLFSYDELKTATNNFDYNGSLLGEGGFGAVFKGTFEPTDLVVAIKVLLDNYGLQGKNEFLVEALMLPRLDHPNVINLVGCCIEGAHRILVYELMPLGSLEKHLHDFALTTPELLPLVWKTRLRIAHGVAKALDYLHNEARPGPIIHRDLKPGNILLGDGFHPKISDFGFAMYGSGYHEDDWRIFTNSVMGTRAYSAPEFLNTRTATTKSDVYSFGVVLLELFTGRRAIDVHTRANDQYHLAHWVLHKITDGDQDIVRLADPRMNGQFPKDAFRKVIYVALNCTEDDQESRPSMRDVVGAMDEFQSQECDDHESSRVLPRKGEGRSENHSGVADDEHEVPGPGAVESNFRSLPETNLGGSAWGNQGQKYLTLNINPYTDGRNNKGPNSD